MVEECSGIINMISEIKIPKIQLELIIEFDESEGVFTTEEKRAYQSYFQTFLQFQSVRRIPYFYYSTEDKLNKLVIVKVPRESGGGAAHMGNYVKIIDNGFRAGLPIDVFFYHEMGHLVTYMRNITGSGSCCGSLSEGVANIITSEMLSRNPSKIVFGQTVMYLGTAFAEQWYMHAEKHNYPIIYQDSHETRREDREYAYLFLCTLYDNLMNGMSIADDNTVWSAHVRALDFKDKSALR